MDTADSAMDMYIRSPVAIRRELSFLFRVKGPSVIFDIGACEGEDSIRYARLFPHAIIHAFEPVAENAERVRKNIQRHGTVNVRIIQKALSDQVGRRTIYLSGGRPEKSDPNIDYGNKSSSILRPGEETKKNTPWLAFDNEEQIECDTIDAYCGKQSIKAIDLVHMDVQGAELLVLRGAHARILNIKAIWLEVSEVEFYEKQPLAADVKGFMEKNGFKLMVDRYDKHLQYGDRLYVNTRFFPATKIAACHAFDLARRLKGMVHSYISHLCSTTS